MSATEQVVMEAMDVAEEEIQTVIAYVRKLKSARADEDHQDIADALTALREPGGVELGELETRLGLNR